MVKLSPKFVRSDLIRSGLVRSSLVRSGLVGAVLGKASLVRSGKSIFFLSAKILLFREKLYGVKTI